MKLFYQLVILAFFIGFQCIAGKTTAPRSSPLVEKAYYLMFSSQTFIEMDERLIETYYDISSLVNQRPNDLVRILKSDLKEGRFNLAYLRLKVETTDGTVLVDAFGGVKRGKEQGLLSRKDFADLENTITFSILPPNGFVKKEPKDMPMPPR